MLIGEKLPEVVALDSFAVVKDFSYNDLYQIGYPLIHWSLASGDSGNPHYQKIAQRVIGNVRDGEVVLMHDINENVANYTKRIVEDLCNRGFLCVTVEELFADAGIELVDQAVYYGTYRGETVE